MSTSKKMFLVAGIILTLMLFLGCTTNNPSGSGYMGLDANKIDTNKLDTNTNGAYNNLDSFKVVKVGDKIAVHYVGRLTDGTIFDSSIGKDPLVFVAGAGQMIKGFDVAVIGMKINEKKTIELTPVQAYGEHDPARVVSVDKNQFAQFDQLQVGVIVSGGNGITGKVISKNDTNAVIDFNHELAGKTLVFEIILVSIN